MITKLRVHNFRTLLNFQMDLTRRHLLIGKNNSGKSNLCHALRFLGSSCWADYQTLVNGLPGGRDSLRHWHYKGLETHFKIECELPFDEGDLQYEYELQLRTPDESAQVPTPSSSPSTVLERLTVEGCGWPKATLIESDGQQVTLLHEGRHEEAAFKPSEETFIRTKAPTDCSMLNKLYELDTNRRAIYFRRFLGAIRYYAVSPPLMRFGLPRQPTEPRAAFEMLSSYGDNLAAALFQMKNRDEPRYRRMIEFATRLEPDLDSINFNLNPAGGEPNPFVIMKRQNKPHGWATLSDGTLCALALAYAFHFAEGIEEIRGHPPSVVVIEEPENGLFRGLLPDLWEKLRAVAPRSQFILTTHSPYFIDLFDRDLGSVVFLKRDKDLTTAHPLADHADAIHEALEHSSLGEQHFRELLG